MKKIASWLKIAFWGSGIVLLWMGSAHFLLKILTSRKPIPGSTPSMSDLATIFFGASSIALIIFSLLVAVAAMIQWRSLDSKVRKTTKAAKTTLGKADKATRDNEAHVTELEERMKTRIDELEKELRGRVDAVMGAMIGTLNSDPTSPTQSESHLNYISEAIHHAQRGYDRLKELKGNGKYMALNSVVYFSCLTGSSSKRDLLLAQGKELRDVGRKYEYLPYSAPYLMTFCRVALVYETNLNELRQALAIAENLLETTLTKMQKKETTYLVVSLENKIAELSDPEN